jgi:hypothetical protein
VVFCPDEVTSGWLAGGGGGKPASRVTRRISSDFIILAGKILFEFLTR